MLALIGFIVLVCLGIYLLFVAGFLCVSSLFGFGKSEFLLPAAVAVLVFWLAFHFAPFTVHFTG
jgi:hypothetical protein